MKLKTIWGEEKEINGQTLFVFNRAGLKEILCNDSILEDMNLVVRRILLARVEEYGFRSGIHFALGQLGNVYLPYTLLEINNKIYRIHIEKIICKNCGQSSIIANPSVEDNYIGSDGKRPEGNFQIQCPSCDTYLPRPAVCILEKKQSGTDPQD